LDTKSNASYDSSSSNDTITEDTILYDIINDTIQNEDIGEILVDNIIDTRRKIFLTLTNKATYNLLLVSICMEYANATNSLVLLILNDYSKDVVFNDISICTEITMINPRACNINELDIQHSGDLIIVPSDILLTKLPTSLVFPLNYKIDNRLTKKTLGVYLSYDILNPTVDNSVTNINYYISLVNNYINKFGSTIKLLTEDKHIEDLFSLCYGNRMIINSENEFDDICNFLLCDNMIIYEQNTMNDIINKIPGKNIYSHKSNNHMNATDFKNGSSVIIIGSSDTDFTKECVNNWTSCIGLKEIIVIDRYDNEYDETIQHKKVKIYRISEMIPISCAYNFGVSKSSFNSLYISDLNIKYEYGVITRNKPNNSIFYSHITQETTDFNFIFCTRNVFDMVGGFNENLVFEGYEFIDLHVRLLQHTICPQELSLTKLLHIQNPPNVNYEFNKNISEINVWDKHSIHNEYIYNKNTNKYDIKGIYNFMFVI
jgi:hypothetical protein